MLHTSSREAESGRSWSWNESKSLTRHASSFISLQSRSSMAGRRRQPGLPLQLLHLRAGLRQDADAPPVRRPSVQVEGQVMELCWLTAGEARHLVGSWGGSQVVDPQEVSRLRRQAEPQGEALPPQRQPLLDSGLFSCRRLTRGSGCRPTFSGLDRAGLSLREPPSRSRTLACTSTG